MENLGKAQENLGKTEGNLRTTTDNLRKNKGKPSLFVITRNQSDIYGRNLVEMDPTSLPHLSAQGPKKQAETWKQARLRNTSPLYVSCTKMFDRLLFTILSYYLVLIHCLIELS